MRCMYVHIKTVEKVSFVVVATTKKYDIARSVFGLGYNNIK